MTPVPPDPAAGPSVPVRAARDNAPGGPGLSPSPERPGGKTSRLLPVSGPPGAAAGIQGPARGARANSQATSAPLTGSMAVMAAAMSEDDLLLSVTCGTRKKPGLCKLYGLLYYHTHNSKSSPSGFPDLVIVGRGVMYRELKRQKEDPTPKQEEWLAALKAAGQDADVWRPADWLSGRVGRELAALAGRRTTGGAA